MEKISEQCKIDSFYSAKTQKARTTQKQIILSAIKFLGMATQRQINQMTGLQRHLIPDRIIQLLRENKVCIAGKVHDELTNKQVTTYKFLGKKNEKN
jgi:predicted HTH transcriptional regulator